MGFTKFDRRGNWTVARHVAFHVNRFYSIKPFCDESVIPEVKKKLNHCPTDHSSYFGKAVKLKSLPVKDADKFFANVDSLYAPGTILWIEYPDVNVPEHFGYWLELFAPVFSHLSHSRYSAKNGNIPKTSTVLKAVMIPNLRRDQVMAIPWIIQLLNIAVAPGSVHLNAPPPHLLFWDDIEGVVLSQWIVFEKLLHVHNRHNHPDQKSIMAFPSHDMANKFRKAVFEATGVAWKQENTRPTTITYLMPAAEAGIVNNGEVVKALRLAASQVANDTEYRVHQGGKPFRVRPYTATLNVPLSSLVSIMSSTALLVGRHSSLLANAIFLPPGSAVLEILPYNYDVFGLNEVYRNLTEASGNDIGHIAWRAGSPDFMVYTSPETSRYGMWTSEECSSPTCLQAHNSASILVDCKALTQLSTHVLRAVLRNESGDALRSRFGWPPGVKLSGTTGLWWDK